MVVDEVSAQGEHRSNTHPPSSAQNTHDSTTVVLRARRTQSDNHSRPKSKTDGLCAMLDSTSTTRYSPEASTYDHTPNLRLCSA